MEPQSAEVLRNALESGAEALGIRLEPEKLQSCLRYADLLLEYNRHTNLTRITDPESVAVKHFVDSLTVLAVVPHLAKGGSLADIGTGAGFPGLVLKIACPDLHVTLIDSLGKRLTFLAEVVQALGLPNVTLVHARAEDVGRDPAHRDRYDVVTARAVAALPVLLEWCGPLARPGGVFVAMKAAQVDTELAQGVIAAAELGFRLRTDTTLTLPALAGDEAGASTRRLLVYKKHQPTPARYPRRPAEIKAAPLGS